MKVITRDEYVPMWVGQRGVSDSRHETVELMKALALIAGQDVKIIENEGMTETDNEFRDRMSTMTKFLVESADKKYPYSSIYEDIKIYTGGNDAIIARLNGRIASQIWRLYHRLLHIRLLDEREAEINEKRVG